MFKAISSVMGVDKRELVRKYGRLYSEELGIRLCGGDSGEIFRWFLASVLFGAPISESVARKTYLLLKASGADTPDAILKKGWKGLVGILDEGGYTRYDFKTADKLLEMSRSLKAEYKSDLNFLYKGSASEKELRGRLILAKGIGPITVEIFLREMAGIWKVKPRHTPVVVRTAKRMGIRMGKRFDKRLDAALVRWAHEGA